VGLGLSPTICSSGPDGLQPPPPPPPKGASVMVGFYSRVILKTTLLSHSYPILLT
jgi:hypothetical protein